MPPGNTAADARYKECQFRVLFCIGRKIVNVLTDNINASVHCRNCIALTGHADTDAPFWGQGKNPVFMITKKYVPLDR